MARHRGFEPLTYGSGARGQARTGLFFAVGVTDVTANVPGAAGRHVVTAANLEGRFGEQGETDGAYALGFSRRQKSGDHPGPVAHRAVRVTVGTLYEKTSKWASNP